MMYSGMNVAKFEFVNSLQEYDKDTFISYFSFENHPENSSMI